MREARLGPHDGIFRQAPEVADEEKRVEDSQIIEKFGAGDRDRTGDVQLGNFLVKRLLSLLITKTYPTFFAPETFFRALVISISFESSTFVLGTFWSRELSAI